MRNRSPTTRVEAFPRLEEVLESRYGEVFSKLWERVKLVADSRVQENVL